MVEDREGASVDIWENAPSIDVHKVMIGSYNGGNVKRTASDGEREPPCAAIASHNPTMTRTVDPKGTTSFASVCTFIIALRTPFVDDGDYHSHVVPFVGQQAGNNTEEEAKSAFDLRWRTRLRYVSRSCHYHG